MQITAAFVMSMIAAIHPSATKTGSAPSFAVAIAYVASTDEPPIGMSRELGAAMLVTYGWAESRFSAKPRRGDGGRSVCAFQVMAYGQRAALLERDPIACARAAYAVLRASYATCGDGRGYCGNCRAKDGAPAALIARERARAAQGILDSAWMSAALP